MEDGLRASDRSSSAHSRLGCVCQMALGGILGLLAGDEDLVVVVAKGVGWPMRISLRVPGLD